MSRSLQQVYAKTDALVHRQIADETILVPIRRDAADLESIYALEGAGPRIWEFVDGQRTVADIVSCVVEEYDVDPEAAEADVLDFLSQLESFGAVERAS
jgi:hypothetical protein